MSVKRLVVLWQTSSKGEFFRFLASRVIRKRRHVVYVMDSSEASAPVWGPETQVRVVVSEDDVESNSAIATNLHEVNHEYMEGIRKGEVIGVFVLVDGVLAHWAFILRSSRTSCLLGVGRGEALLGNAYTNPQFRGRGLQTTSLRQRLQECRRLGITHVYTETVPDNWPSRRAMERVGMVFLRDVTLLVVVTRIVLRITNTGRKARLFGLC